MEGYSDAVLPGGNGIDVVSDAPLAAKTVEVTFNAPAGLDIAHLPAEIHQGNVEAGWWSDLKTGESILATRNRGELMMLVVSELSEASYGNAAGCRDDKLPHLAMFDVELADAAIRLFDMIGAEDSLSGIAWSMPEFASVRFEDRDFQSFDRGLMKMVNIVSAAMEAHRKGRINEYRDRIGLALVALFVFADQLNIPLLTIIAEKRAFNASRADHKVENRRAVGGKAY